MISVASLALSSYSSVVSLLLPLISVCECERQMHNSLPGQVLVRRGLCPPSCDYGGEIQTAMTGLRTTHVGRDVRCRRRGRVVLNVLGRGKLTNTASRVTTGHPVSPLQVPIPAYLMNASILTVSNS